MFPELRYLSQGYYWRHLRSIQAQRLLSYVVGILSLHRPVSSTANMVSQVLQHHIHRLRRVGNSHLLETASQACGSTATQGTRAVGHRDSRIHGRERHGDQIGPDAQKGLATRDTEVRASTQTEDRGWAMAPGAPLLGRGECDGRGSRPKLLHVNRGVS